MRSLNKVEAGRAVKQLIERADRLKSSRLSFWLYSLLIMATVLSEGCTRDLPLPAIQSTRQIVLIGELIANDTISFRGGQSVPLASGSNLKFELPQALNVNINDLEGNNFTLSGKADEFSAQVHTLGFTCPWRIRENCHYKLNAFDDKSDSASCEVSVPGPFTIILEDTASVLYSGANMFRINLKFFDNATVDEYYVVEAVKQSLQIDGTYAYNGKTYKVSDAPKFYDSLKTVGIPLNVRWDTTFSRDLKRIDIYTNDPATENIKLSNALSTNRRILLADEGFSGSTHETSVYLDRSSFISSGTDRGQIILKVKSVNADYFRFLKAYEMYEPTTGFTSLAQPVKIEGNVKGGMGMVGGVYQYQYKYIFDKWSY